MTKKHLAAVLPAILICFCASCAQSDEATSSHEHTYSSEWVYDEECHWHPSTCDHDEKKDRSYHHFADWVIDKAATETNDGSKHRSCTVCDYKVTSVIEKTGHEHTYSKSWSSDADYHWHASTCGHAEEIKDKTEHTFGTWVIDTQPTEEEEGARHRLCSVCRYKQSEAMEKLTHVHNWKKPTYSWSLDYSTCTAKRVCSINLYHVEQETARSTSSVTLEPTTEATRRRRYTAAFENSAFATQTKDVTIPKVGVKVTGISISEETISLSKGNYNLLWPTVTPSNASNKNIIWASSDENVVTAAGGLLYGVGEGTATVTATTEDGGFSDSVEVTVTYVALAGISITKKSIVLEKNEESETIRATPSPSDASNGKVTWTISNSSVASFEVTATGGAIVKGLSAGSATLTATSEEGGYTASCQVTVLDKKNLTYSIGDAKLRLYQSGTSTCAYGFVPITNTGNVKLYVYLASFDIEDKEENLKQSVSQYSVKTYPKIIRPGETTYAYFDVSYTGDSTSDLVLIPHLDLIDASSADDLRYDVSATLTFGLDSYSNSLVASGSVSNGNEESGSSVYIAVLLFDNDGAYFGTLTKSTYRTLESGASLDFTAGWDYPYRHGGEYGVNDVATYKVYAWEWESLYKI